MRVHAEVRMARRLKALSIEEVSPLTLPVSIISWTKFPTGDRERHVRPRALVEPAGVTNCRRPETIGLVRGGERLEW